MIAMFYKDGQYQSNFERSQLQPTCFTIGGFFEFAIQEQLEFIHVDDASKLDANSEHVLGATTKNRARVHINLLHSLIKIMLKYITLEILAWNCLASSSPNFNAAAEKTFLRPSKIDLV